MITKRKPNEKGFSLTELMVGLTMLTIGMLAVGAMLKTSSELSKRSVQSTIGDAIALELMEAVKAQAAINTLTELQNVRIQKLMPGSSTLYEYQDANTYTAGTSTTYTTNDTQYVERLGEGRGYVYKWHLEIQSSSSWPSKIMKLDVTVGWSNCSGSSPQNPNNCSYKTKVTTFILGMVS
jgi:prepilin-type N-terminal cleavage/methylation domain-containing protein